VTYEGLFVKLNQISFKENFWSAAPLGYSGAAFPSLRSLRPFEKVFFRYFLLFCPSKPVKWLAMQYDSNTRSLRLSLRLLDIGMDAGNKDGWNPKWISRFSKWWFSQSFKNITKYGTVHRNLWNRVPGTRVLPDNLIDCRIDHQRS